MTDMDFSTGTSSAPAGSWNDFINTIVRGTNSIITTARGSSNDPTSPGYVAPTFGQVSAGGSNMMLIAVLVLVAVVLLKK